MYNFRCVMAFTVLLFVNTLFGADAFFANVGDVFLLKSADSEFLGLSDSGEVTCIQTSSLDPATHLALVAYDDVNKRMTVRVGTKNISLSPDNASLVAEAGDKNVTISFDVAAKKMSFVSGTNPVGVSSARLRAANLPAITSFSFVGPLTQDQKVFDDTFNALQGTLTKEGVRDSLQKGFQVFLTKPQKTASDWTLFVGLLSAVAKKAAVDVSDWSLPYLDIVDQDQSMMRISLKDYTVRLFEYVKDPFAGASEDAIAQAVAAIEMLSKKNPVVATQASGFNFAANMIVALQIPAKGSGPVKSLVIQDNGKIQQLSSVSRFLPEAQFKIVSFDAEKNFLQLSSKDRFFDSKTGEFTATAASDNSRFVVEQASAGQYYLLVGANQRLTFSTTSDTGCSFGKDGTALLINQLDRVYANIALLAAPLNASDIDSSLGFFSKAIEVARTNTDDFGYVFAALKKYCEQACDIPDWSLVMDGTTVKAVSPMEYVKSLLNSILTLRARYSGVNDSLSQMIQTFVASKIFTTITLSGALASGAACILKANTNRALGLDNAGLLVMTAFSSAFDPSFHCIVSQFDQAKLQIALSYGGKPIVIDDSGSKLNVGDAATQGTVLRIMQESQGGYSLLNPQNKKLRLSADGATCAFGDSGSLVLLSLIGRDQRVLVDLSGSYVKDLKVFERALQMVATSSADLNFIISQLIAYSAKSANQIDWFTTVGADAKNPQASTRDFSVTLLKRVRDSSWVFTGLNDSIKGKINEAVGVISNNTALYEKQTAQLDELALKLAKPEDVTTSSELFSVLKSLIPGVVSSKKLDQCEIILNKVESFYDESVIPGLAGVQDAEKKVSWAVGLYTLSDQLLLIDARDKSDWDLKLDLMKDMLVARAMSSDASLKSVYLGLLLKSSLKKMAVESGTLSISGLPLKSFKKILNDVAYDVSQLSDDAEVKPEVVKSLTEGLKDVLKIAGVQLAPVVETVQEAPAPVVEKTVAPAPETPRQPVVPAQSQQNLSRYDI